VAGTFWPTLYIRQFYGLCKIRVNLAWRLKRRRLEFNGSLSWSILMFGYIPKWFTCPRRNNRLGLSEHDASPA